MKLIPNDDPESIKLEFEQVKVGKKSAEGTGLVINEVEGEG